MDCKKRYTDSIEMITNVTKSITLMNSLEIKMTDFHNDLKAVCIIFLIFFENWI